MFPQRDRAAAPAHTAEGHVPVIGPGLERSGQAGGGFDARNGPTNPDVDVSEILSSLDADSRNYLLLLLSGGAQIFRDHGDTEQPSPQAVGDLRGTLKRFAPLNRDTESFAQPARDATAQPPPGDPQPQSRRRLARERRHAAVIADPSSDTNFTAISSNDAQLEDTLQQFPATLRQADQTLGKVKTFANATGTTLTALQPFARNLAPALRATRPLFKDTTPVIANQLRPVSVSLQPLAKTLAPAAAHSTRRHRRSAARSASSTRRSTNWRIRPVRANTATCSTGRGWRTSSIRSRPTRTQMARCCRGS